MIDAIERGDAEGPTAPFEEPGEGSERYARVMETVGEKGIW